MANNSTFDHKMHQNPPVRRQHIILMFEEEGFKDR